MLTPVSNIRTEGDLGGRKIAMQFDESSLSHLMSIMIDMYSDRELACIREYSTNALDSHKEAGNTDPIEVTTPTALSPYFIVQDYGVGLSVNDIETMYSKYGASTKRGTNEQVGMLGIGAKSALTLVPQFNIISVKNGVRIHVHVSRDSSGAGHMNIVDTSATDERNGVRIEIPIRDANSFERKAVEFFRFWEPGTVLLNGQEPKGLNGQKVGEKFIIDRDLDSDYVIMGNVAYPVKTGLYDTPYYYRHIGIVARVPIGAVNFTPSREELSYTEQTKETIKRLKVEFSQDLLTSAHKDIEEAPNHAEAWSRANQWRRNFGGVLKTLLYKGTAIPQALDIEVNFKDIDLFASRAVRYASWIRSIDAESHDRYIFITDFSDNLKVSPTQRQRIRKYCELNKLSFQRAAVSNRPESDIKKSVWTENMVIVSWANIAKIKIDIARTASGARVVRTDPYDLYGGGGSYDLKSVSTLDVTKDIIYISPTENKAPRHLKTIFPDAQIVMLAMNRWEKFKRDWPTAKHHAEKLSETKDALMKKLTDTDLILWNYSDFKYIAGLINPDDVVDPELAKFVRVLTEGKFSADAEKLRDISVYPQGLTRPENPLTRYPMHANLGRTSREHINWYLNSYYTEILSKENN